MLFLPPFFQLLHGLRATTCKKKRCKKAKRSYKTFHTQDSQVVTDPSTSWAILWLMYRERTGTNAFTSLWRNAQVLSSYNIYTFFVLRMWNTRALDVAMRQFLKFWCHLYSHIGWADVAHGRAWSVELQKEINHFPEKRAIKCLE